MSTLSEYLSSKLFIITRKVGDNIKYMNSSVKKPPLRGSNKVGFEIKINLNTTPD